MLVELDIFSGRPNPRFVLSSMEEEIVTDLYERLPVGAGAASPAKDGLGYRGFRILDSQSNLVAIVQGTAVQIRKGAAATMDVKFDEHRLLELALLRISKSHLSPETYAFLQSQLET
jgi:DNA-directed RNA polymerase subunit K/omega